MAVKIDVSSRIALDEMRAEDLDGIMDIEHKCFPTPWPRGVFEMELRSPRAFNLAARIDGVLVGYIISWRIYDEIHILNVAVHPDFRRMGVGRHLIGNCLGHFADKGANHALLEVRTSNYPALTLYNALGFEQVGLRKSYYTDNGEDAIVMILSLK